MKNGARYVVTTHWGTFSLDEGSYQDYLAGKLWICWAPGKQKQQTEYNYTPKNVTNEALNLRDQSETDGALSVLSHLGIRKAIVPYSSRFSVLSIDEMNLTVRSSNGLKRANIHTFGRLKEQLESENALMNIRNIGQKSVTEIKKLFFEECYLRLSPHEKAQYWQEILNQVTE